MEQIADLDIKDACDTLEPKKKKEMDEAISPDFAEVIKLVGGKGAFLKIVKDDELTDDQYEKLFDHFSDEMPYGTQKAKTGDPHEWIIDKLKSLGKPMEESKEENSEESEDEMDEANIDFSKVVDLKALKNLPKEKLEQIKKIVNKIK